MYLRSLLAWPIVKNRVRLIQENSEAMLELAALSMRLFGPGKFQTELLPDNRFKCSVCPIVRKTIRKAKLSRRHA
jgi:hypothetical protein